MSIAPERKMLCYYKIGEAGRLLTFTSVGRLERPELLLLQAGAIGIQLEAKGLRGHILVLAIDQSDGPPALLLVL